jgi:hypothetical protein
MVHAAYMLRSGYSDDVIQKVLIRGDDKWEFSANGNILQADGPNKSMFAVYHNREGYMEGSGDGVARTWHTETINGEGPIEIAEALNLSGLFLVLCSHSAHIEDSTAAAMYIIKITDGNIEMTDPYILTGKTYENTTDLWKFEVSGTSLTVVGPKGPCRYAILSNLKLTGQPKQRSLGHCLATGLDQPIRGAVTINEQSVIGWLSEPCDVIIKVNQKAVANFAAKSLKKKNNKYAFHRAWTDEEKVPGLYMISAYCVITRTGQCKM